MPTQIMLNYGITMATIKFRKASETPIRLKETILNCAIIWLDWRVRPAVFHGARML